MEEKFITNTSSIKTTHANVRKIDAKVIDAKNIKINGEDILDKIKENKTIIKHAQDTRETVTENDLWGQWVETLEDGTIVIHDDEVTNPNGSSAWNTSITKVEDNKAYVGEDLFANIQIEQIKDGENMFLRCSQLTSFSSDLPSLTNGYGMFYNCSNLNSFSSDLSSLMNGIYMFYYCTKITSFNSDLSSLTDGGTMFAACTNLTTFSSDLPSLTDGLGMFYNCSNLTTFSSNLPSMTCGATMFQSCSKLASFNSDLPSMTYGGSMFSMCENLTTFSSDLSSLTNGYNMFNYCTNLTSFSSDLSSLIDGRSMFDCCKLNAQSVMYIIHSINDIVAEKQLYIDGTIPYVTLSNNVYSAPKGFMSDGKYVYTYNNTKITTSTISASNVGKLEISIDVTNDTNTIEQQLQTFAEGTLFDSWADLKQAFVDKGWTVTWQYGGSRTSITYDLRGGERIIPCPVYTKLIEILPQEGEELTEE